LGQWETFKEKEKEGPPKKPAKSDDVRKEPHQMAGKELIEKGSQKQKRIK